MSDLLAIRAESLYEELGGDLCSCQNTDCPHWCEKCQQRIAYILTVFRRLREEGQQLEKNAAQAQCLPLTQKGMYERAGRSDWEERE